MEPHISVDCKFLATKFGEVLVGLNILEEREEPGDAHYDACLSLEESSRFMRE